MIHPSTKYLTFNAPKNVTPQNLLSYRKKYISNNSVWPPENVTKQQYGPTILHILQILWTHFRNVQKNLSKISSPQNRQY